MTKRHQAAARHVPTGAYASAFRSDADTEKRAA